MVVVVVACLRSRSSWFPFMRTVLSGWSGNNLHALVLCLLNALFLEFTCSGCMVGYNLWIWLCCIGLGHNFFLTWRRNAKIGIPLVCFLSCLNILQNLFLWNALAFTLRLTLCLNKTLPAKKAGFSFSVLCQCSLGAWFFYCTPVTSSLTTSASLRTVFDKLVAHPGSLFTLPALGSGQQC